jgi:hypothetical protein
MINMNKLRERLLKARLAAPLHCHAEEAWVDCLQKLAYKQCHTGCHAFI